MKTATVVDQNLKNELDDLFGNQRENVETAVRALKLFAHADRLKILCILCQGGEYSVQLLEEYTEIPQANLSQHLSSLKDRKIVVSRREGNYSLYRIANEEIAKLFLIIKEIYCE